MRISFLVHDAYGVGGTVRTVLNLAEALSERHSVEVVSVYRRRTQPRFHIPKGVRLVPLVDARKRSKDGRHSRASVRSELVPAAEQYYDQYTGLTDDRISAYLARCGSDVVIGTRPSLNLCLAQLGRPSMLKIAQEHMTYEMLPAQLRSSLRQHYRGIDASVAVTEADARDFRSDLADTGARFLCIPNGVPDPPLPPADGTAKVVMAAGRLVDWKRFDLLVNAFARVVPRHPDWTLRIYGEGSQAKGLRRLITELGVHNHVLLMGRVSPLESEWVKASIGVSSSDMEPFGMTLVEAMRCGVPMVATNCRHGPPEIVRHGEDGLLTPVGSVDGLAEALLTLMGDDDLRRRMGAAARRNSERYSPREIVSRYEALFDELMGTGRVRTRPLRRAVAAARGTVARLPYTIPREVGLRPLARFVLSPVIDTPVGDCVVEPDGDMTIRLRPTRTGPTPHLICRATSRRGKPTVRIPLRREDGKGVLRQSALTASVPLGTLGQGTWDLYLERVPGLVQRIRGGVRDLRSLLDTSRAANGAVVAQVPHHCSAGYLSVRCRARDRHFEVLAVRYGDKELTVEGRLYGADPPSTVLTLTLTRLQHPSTSLVVHGERLNDGTYRFAVPVDQVADARLLRAEDWKLSVVDQRGKKAAVAHLLDDIADPAWVYTFPAMRVNEEEEPLELFEQSPSTYVTVKPEYTADGDLILTVAELDE